jgi:hypothetical protein
MMLPCSTRLHYFQKASGFKLFLQDRALRAINKARKEKTITPSTWGFIGYSTRF